MKNQPNRLAIDRRHLLGGACIDRNAPLRFRLDGRVIHGFDGDTVLSALIASGIDIVGHRGGYPVALSARFAPPIAFADRANDRSHALPMTRTPALDGAEFVTLRSHPAHSRAKRLLSRLRRPARSLGIDLDRPGSITQPWLDMPAEDTLSDDVIIVGGGVTGLSAALAAAHAGHSVVLLEASPVLGGHARLFGTLEGEEPPDHSINRLTAAVAATDAITVVTRAEAIAVRPGAVRAHVVAPENNTVTGQVIDYRAASIILATGTLERLPLFFGNRLPGVVGTEETYELAYRYGVWPGKSALFATVSSAAYRLAMLASDAGIAIGRIVDGRPHPQSRFIEFCKAYGITQSPGMIPAQAEWPGGKKNLSITLQLALEGIARLQEPVAADTLIVCGGWQPNLLLWHMAGGQSRWNAEHARMEAADGPSTVALAGSAAGYFSKQACLQSGEDVVHRLLEHRAEKWEPVFREKRYDNKQLEHRAPVRMHDAPGTRRSPIVEHLIDPFYETPDDPTPISGLPASNRAPAFLDSASSLIALPVPPRPGWRWLSPFAPPPPAWSPIDQPQALDICDVAAGVQLGVIPVASAGIVAQERAAFNGDPTDAAGMASYAALTPPPVLPDFLAGRFGQAPALWNVIPDEPRTLETGALIFINSDQTDPRQAIGVIVRADSTSALALIGKAAPSPGEGMTVREQGRIVPVRLGEPYAGPALAPPLGSEPGPL